MEYLDRLRDFIKLAETCDKISKSGAEAEVIYDTCFGIYRNIRALDLNALDYCDPDTTYEEDTRALVSALNHRAEQYRLLLAAAEAA